MATTKEMSRAPSKSATLTTGSNDTALALVHVHRGIPVTDFLVIASTFQRRHNNVLRSLDGLIADGTINHLNFEEVELADNKGEVRRAIELTEHGALIAMSFIGGRNSRVGQIRLVNAFFAQRELLARKSSRNWIDVRQKAASGYRFLSQSLEMARADDGKNTVTHHYTNEARLLNWVAFGRFAGVERAELPESDLALLEALEVRDMMFLSRGIPYSGRKVALSEFAAQWRMKHLIEHIVDPLGAPQ